MFFRLWPAEGYEWVLPVRSDHGRAFDELDGSLRAGAWAPVEVYRTDPDERKPGKPADFPWCSRALVMRRTALDAVGELLARGGEILPLTDSEGVELWIFNAPVVPALDESKSEIWRFTDGRIMYVKSAALVETAIHCDVFRVHAGSDLFVSERFAHRVQEHRLSGLRFEEVSGTGSNAH